jgi:hypothetical protein
MNAYLHSYKQGLRDAIFLVWGSEDCGDFIGSPTKIHKNIIRMMAALQECIVQK